MSELLKANRAAVAQSEHNAAGYGILIVQFLIIAGLVYATYESWEITLGTFFGVIVLMVIPGIRQVLLLALAAVWGLVAYTIAAEFGEWSTTGQYVAAGIAFMTMAGVNFAGLQHIKDLSYE
jgi:hypothetical protein